MARVCKGHAIPLVKDDWSKKWFCPKCRKVQEELKTSKETEITCKHENGWVLKEEIVIDEEGDDNLIAEFECNNIGCRKRKKFKFDVINVEEQ